jgi:cell division transport system permease protein
MRFRFVLSEINVGLRRNLTMTVAVVVTVAVSLGLFGMSLLVQDTVQRMNYYYFGKLQVALFLSPSITETERLSLAKDLASDPLVKNVVYVSQAQALTRFKQEFSSDPALVQEAEDNPSALPESFRVQLKNPRQDQLLASEYANTPGVSKIIDYSGLLKRIFGILDGVRLSAVAIAVVQLIACILLIYNTIRLAAFSRRRETGIMRLVGAGAFTIQIPFLLEGAIAGLLGGLLACLGLAGVKRFMFDGALRPLFRGVIPNIGWDQVIHYMPLLVILGVVASAAIAFGTVTRYLRV